MPIEEPRPLSEEFCAHCAQPLSTHILVNRRDADIPVLICPVCTFRPAPASALVSGETDL